MNHIARDLTSLEQLEARREQVLRAIVVGPTAVRVAEVAAGPQHSRNFAEESPAIVIEVRSLDVDDDVERRVGQVELFGITERELERRGCRALVSETDVLGAQVQ